MEMKRIFNVQGDYIETQNITVNEGGVLNFGLAETSSCKEKDRPPLPLASPPLWGEMNGDEDGNECEVEPVKRRNFGLMMHSGHSPVQIEQAMERLRIMCKGSNSRALMRLLVELDKDGYIQIDDVKANELYKELAAAFDMPLITKKAFAESYRLIG